VILIFYLIAEGTPSSLNYYSGKNI